MSYTIPLMALSVSCFELATAACVMVLVTAIEGKASLTGPALTILCMYVLKNMLSYLETKNLASQVQKANYDLKINAMCAYINMDYEDFLSINSALPMQTIEHDTERVTTLGLSALGGLVSESVVSIGLLIYCVLIHPLIALGAFSIIASIGYIAKKTRVLSKLGAQIQEQALACSVALNHLFGGLKEIKVAKNLSFFMHKYGDPAYNKCKLQAKSSTIASMPRLVIEALFALLLVAIVFFIKENLLGILSAYLYAGFRLMPAFNRMVTNYNTIKAVSPSIERLYACLFP